MVFFLPQVNHTHIHIVDLAPVCKNDPVTKYHGSGVYSKYHSLPVIHRNQSIRIKRVYSCSTFGIFMPSGV